MESRPLYIVTGASGGMGQVLTTELLRRGYRTVMACRDLKKSEPIRQRILQRCSVTELELLPLDLASLDAIRQFPERLKQRNETIGVLINNAGSMNGSFRLSQDGYEMTTAVNYIGTAALTLSLLPLMHPGSRIINTLSCTYRIGKVDPGWTEIDREHFARFKCYGNSKLALLLFSLELERTLRSRGIEVFAADPGVVDTGMITMHRWFDPITDLLFRPLIKSPEKGAATALKLATEKALPNDTSNLYWMGEKPKKISDHVLSHPYRTEIGKELLRLTGLQMPAEQ